MKKLLIAIGVTLAVTVNAQDTNGLSLGGIERNLTTATNYGLVTYGLYGLQNHKVGAGALVLYNVNNYIGAGVGAEYVGTFNIVSGNAQLKLPLRPLLFTGSNLGTNLIVTPFMYAGIGKPTGGTGGAGVSTHEGTGLVFDFAKFKSWHVGVGGAYIFRQNAGNYSGNYGAGFITLH